MANLRHETIPDDTAQKCCKCFKGHDLSLEIKSTSKWPLVTDYNASKGKIEEYLNTISQKLLEKLGSSKGKCWTLYNLLK